MARLPRLYAEGFAQLAQAQFTHNNDAVVRQLLERQFADIGRWLRLALADTDTLLHGWVVTHSGLTLLATPGDSTSLARGFQQVGRHLASRLQAGGVFDGRFHSTIPQPQRWLLPCLIWLERQPVREGLVPDAETWRWSSAGAHTGSLGASAVGLHPHTDYWSCGNTPFDRQAIYRKLLQEGNASSQDAKLEACLRGQWGLGDDVFLTELAKLANRRVHPERRGRPKKVIVGTGLVPETVVRP
jgi:putative transposase